MTAARKRAFKGNSAAWRPAAYASISANFKKMFPDADRDERLAWIVEYLGIKVLASMTDLTDEQLGAVAGEMKRLTGHASQAAQSSAVAARSGNVVQGEFGKAAHDAETETPTDGETVFLASPEQIYTLDKLQQYLKWSPSDVFEFVRKRVLRGNARLTGSVPNFHMLTFKQATTAVNALLHVAGHRDLKIRGGDRPVSRVEVNKYIPILKRELQIDR